MNAGAYGGELKDIIENVTFICPDGLIKTETADKLDFGYRHSMFENGGYTILSCKLKLKKGNYDEIKALMAVTIKDEVINAFVTAVSGKYI